MFRLEIETKNDAFGTAGAEDREYTRNEEVSELLKQVAERILSMEYAGTIRDSNGAKVGSFLFELT